MEKRRLGRSDIYLSVLGFGTVKFGRTEALRYQPFALPDIASLANLLSLAKDLGVNFLDTAAAYGESEERLGALLQKDRAAWVISTKAGEVFSNGRSSYEFSPACLERSLVTSLKRLQTDYVDIFLLHCDANDVETLSDPAVMRVLESFKVRGMARTIGASIKSVQGGLLAVERLDAVMVSFRREYPEQRPIIDRAKSFGKGVIVKKALDCGRSQDFGEALRYCASTPGVTSIAVGTIDPAHLRDNALALTSPRSLRARE